MGSRPRPACFERQNYGRDSRGRGRPTPLGDVVAGGFCGISALAGFVGHLWRALLRRDATQGGDRDKNGVRGAAKRRVADSFERRDAPRATRLSDWVDRVIRADASYDEPALRREPDRSADFRDGLTAADFSLSRRLLSAGAPCDES